MTCSYPRIKPPFTAGAGTLRPLTDSKCTTSPSSSGPGPWLPPRIVNEPVCHVLHPIQRPYLIPQMEYVAIYVVIVASMFTNNSPRNQRGTEYLVIIREENPREHVKRTLLEITERRKLSGGGSSVHPASFDLIACPVAIHGIITTP